MIYTSIKELAGDGHFRQFEQEEGFNKEIISILELMEKVNPCNQEYMAEDNAVVISYILKLNLFNFINAFPLRLRVRIIGLPISVSQKGYWGSSTAVKKIIKARKGLKIVLNGDSEFIKGGRTLSTFIFENKYASFRQYMESLRSPYRRRLSKALEYRENIEIKSLDRKDFNEDHYGLYLSIMERTENPLEVLPKEFFNEYESELYEFIHKKTGAVIGFIQVKEIEDRLYFLFGGFKKEDVESLDIYYNMLLKIIDIGIEKSVKTIEFGQTAEESKTKIGCIQVPKYLYVHHSNPVINLFIRLLLPLFSYRPYKIQHRVFR